MKPEESPFHLYMSEVYGADRWRGLLQAMQLPDKKVARINPYLNLQIEAQSILSLMGQKYLDEDDAERDQQKFYVMDLASLLPPLALKPVPKKNCLDMCAAPGGKTLVLVSLMAKGDDAEFDLTANEISPDRRSRLIRVLKEQLPEKVFRQIKITKHDASKWCLYQKDHYDKILLDAPCSGERFFIADSKAIFEWTKKRSQNMAMRQFALMASAFGPTTNPTKFDPLVQQ